MLVVLLVFFVVLCTFNFNNSGKNGNGADTRLNLLEFLEGIRDDISDIRRELESWNLDIRPLEVQARLLQNKLNVLKLAKNPSPQMLEGLASEVIRLERALRVVRDNGFMLDCRMWDNRDALEPIKEGVQAREDSPEASNKLDGTFRYLDNSLDLWDSEWREFTWRLNDVLVLLYSIVKDLVTLLEVENPSHFPGLLQKLLLLREEIKNELLRWGVPVDPEDADDPSNS